MSVVDLTGEIYTGMWNYEPPFPDVTVRPLPSVPWVETRVYCDIFDGLHSQTGTYLETPAHLLGDASYPLGAVGIEQLVHRPVSVLQLDGFSIDAPNRAPITRAALAACNVSIQPGDAVLISCNWGQHWKDARYLSASPYFTADAINWVLEKKPFLLGSDVPRWENLDRPEGFFPTFYAADILLLAPCINLEKLPVHGFLTALPLRVDTTCCAPCRAVFTDE